jgi:hypothetical protein
MVLILNDLFMKTLDLEQMEKIEGGSCGWAAFGLGLTVLGAFLVTGPIGAGLFAAKFIHGSIGFAQSCS